MMKKMKFLAFLFFLSLLMTSCVVSKKKYEEAEAGRWAALYSRDSLADLLGAARSQNLKLLDDTTRLGTSLRNHQALLSTNIMEKRKLNEQLSTNATENLKLNELLESKIKELEEREKTIAELQSVINDQNEKVKEILDNVKEVLTGFSSDELTIREEGGKIYVAMSDKLLFESGQAIVNKQGEEALGKLASVLKERTDIDVYCEGHTDSIPIKTAVFKDNWDLSVVRATSVTRILTETYGVQPLQILPCGRGEFKPVDTNTTPEGRARNRRTEIIITPKLDKLYNLLEQVE